MSLEAIVAVLVAVLGPWAVFFALRRKRKGERDDTEPMRRPPGEEAAPVANGARDVIRSVADTERAEVDGATSDDTPPTNGAGLANLADERRRRRGQD